jgi:hypothetical protein
MDIVKYTLLFLLLVSCGVKNSLNKDSFFISEVNESRKIILHEDYTFEYLNKEKLSNQYSQGKWLKRRDTILLKSDSRYKTGVINFQENIIEGQNIKITVLNSNNHTITNAGITINENENTGWNTNEFGYVAIPKQEIKSITIHYLGTKYFYSVNDKQSNFFKLQIRLENLEFKYFNNENWILKKRALVSPIGEVFPARPRCAVRGSEESRN